MLTIHQSDIINQAMIILSNSNRLLIKGSAGVGKTFVCDSLIDRYLLANYIRPWEKILCTAPTNKAIAVLKGKIEERDNILFSTVHSAMKLKRQINFKTGDISFKPSYSEKYPPLKNVVLLVIDEASMLNTEVLKYVEQHAKEQGTVVIFLGDEKQLNPINEKESPAFHYDYPEVTLTEIVRQGEGNPIIELSRSIDTIRKRIPAVTSNNTGYTFTNDRDRIISSLAGINGGNELKYLAWTNQDVDNMNKAVRIAIYGEPSKIELGETLIFNAPYKDYFTNEEIKVEKLDILTNEIRVKTLEMSGGYKVDPYVTLELKIYLINGNTRVVHEDSEKDYKEMVKLLKNNAKARLLHWKDYFEFIETFADLKYSHAISIHKSQGSTYDKTIVNMGNVERNRNKVEKQRLIYTAITRASSLVILYNVK